MPVLRYDTGNAPGEALSGIGAALANALNPKTRWEAYALQQRIMLEQLQYQKEMRAYTAQATAVQQFGHLVPPDKLPYIANMIYQGADSTQVEREVALSSGHLIDDTSPEAYAQNREYYIRVFGRLPSDGLIDAGPNTIAANNQIRAEQAGRVKASETTGEQVATQTAIAHPAPGYTQGLSDIERAKAAATAAGTQSVQGINLQEPRILPYNPFTPAQAQAMGAEVMPDGSIRTRASVSYGRGLTIMRPVGDGTFQVGIMPGEAEGAQAYQRANEQELQSSGNEKLTSAYKLGALMDQLQDITGAIKSSGSGQISAAVANWLSSKWGLVNTDKASLIRQANQILTSEIGAARQELGIQRMAQPEIQLAQKSVGSATDPPDAIARIIANNRADVQALIDRGTDAQKVLRGQMDYGQYQDLNNQRGTNLPQHQQEFLNDSLDKYRQSGALPAAVQSQGPVSVSIVSKAPVPDTTTPPPPAATTPPPPPATTTPPPVATTPPPPPAVTTPPPATTAPPAAAATTSPPKAPVYVVGPDGRIVEQ